MIEDPTKSDTMKAAKGTSQAMNERQWEHLSELLRNRGIEFQNENSFNHWLYRPGRLIPN